MKSYFNSTKNHTDEWYDFFGDEMRTFYIFKINKEFKTITRNQPYNLYLALDNIHSMNEDNVKLAYKLFDQICDIPNSKEINLFVFNEFKNSDSYIKFNNNHIINNYYTTENSKLIVHRTYIKLKSTINNPTFFKTLKIFPIFL